MTTRPWIMSAEVSIGDAALAEDYSRLWWDLWFGHKHGITAMAVDHGDLKELSKELAGTYLTHKKLDLHVQGDGTSLDPDSTGGSRGVHGLGSGDHVTGVRTNKLLVQLGEDVVTSYTIGDGFRGRFYYPRPYKEAPFIFVTPKWSSDDDWDYASYYTVFQSFWSNFTVKLLETITFPYSPRGGGSSQPDEVPFFWVALGEEGTPPKDEKREYKYLL